MTMFVTDGHAPSAQGWLGREHAAAIAAPARSFAARLWDAYRGRRARRQTLRMLYSLDDATLRDIGITPHEISSIVCGAPGDRIRDYDENWWRGRR